MARVFDAIISDIDGCLGPERHGPVDAHALAQLANYNRRAIATGDAPPITVCSGRPQPYAEAICRVIANSVLPCVAEMGVWVYDPRDNRFLMDPQIGARDLEVIHACTRWVQQELVPRGVVIQPGKTASISLWHADTAFLLSLKDAIVAQVERSSWHLRVSNTVAWINLELANVSKRSGINRVMAMTGLRPDRLMGIGDTMGDMAIRERVKFFAVPSNAAEELKRHADYVSPHAEVEGVLDILRHVLGSGAGQVSPASAPLA